MTPAEQISEICQSVSPMAHAAVEEQPWMSGLEGTPRPMGYGENSWLSTIIVAMLVLLALNVKHFRRMFKNFGNDLLTIRRRDNAFEDESSKSLRLVILITLTLSISEGILLFTVASLEGFATTHAGVFASTMALSALALGFYLVQIGIYRLVGYAFTDGVGTTQWLRGFNASQSLLAFLLIVPALVALFYPGFSASMAVLAAIFYLTARLLFIAKGFKIFYTNYSSLFYFILYLCTLEIIPLILVRKVAIEILRNL